MKNPVGKRFRFQKTNGTIIGVVKDFHFASLREKIAPVIFFYRPAVYQTMYIKTNTSNAAAAIAATDNQFKQYNGQYPFSYNFLDDLFNDLYQSEQREGTLFNYFSGIAILISCMGLLGLATYTGQVRTREIGVRKVLGASVIGVMGLLAKDFIKLVLIAIVVATPLAWYAMTNWLEAFAYRISMHWTVFVLAACIAIVITFVTISFQSFKAAMANPVKSLRSE